MFGVKIVDKDATMIGCEGTSSKAGDNTILSPWRCQVELSVVSALMRRTGPC